jgi:hypothetical protein
MSLIRGKTIYVLGAGASQHTGAPLLRDFLVAARLLLDGKAELKHRESFIKVFDWVNNLRGSAYYVEFDLDNLEQVFSIAEMLKQLGDGEGEKLSRALTRLVMETLDRTCELRWAGNFFEPDKTLKIFAERLDGLNEKRKDEIGGQHGTFARDLIITFNYDVMLDYAMYQLSMAPEYCLFDPPFDGNKYRLLKLHGSINWGLCKDCNKSGSNAVSLQEVRPMPLAPGREVAPMTPTGTRFKMQMMTEVLPNTPCNSCRKTDVLEPFVIPPTWSKAVGNTPLKGIWAQAVKEIETAFQIVVIGYSMPQTDTFFQYLLTLGLANNSRLNRVVVVNRDQSPEFRESYTRVFSRNLLDRGRLKFLTGETFNQFIGTHMNDVGSKVEWEVS